MRTILLIGIGAGDPRHLTLQAVDAIAATDVFFVLDKGDATAELVAHRRAILERHATPDAHRVVTRRDPERDRDAADYPTAVAAWRSRRADLCEELVRDELPDGGTGAFLIWGDPTLYDGTLDLVTDLAARGTVPLRWEVIPGISSVSALAARHRIPLNRVGGPLQITTGRLLARDGMPDDVDDVAVMLDPHGRFAELDGDDVDIHWGAYLGLPSERLAAGPVTEVAADILAQRDDARRRQGWIMDTYLLRRRTH